MRAALYARVSTEEQVEGYSIDAQKRAFHNLCQDRGWIPHREYIEAGKSAHTDDIRKRPVFKQAIDDALAGQYDVLVVHKIDRFSRKLRITLDNFDKLGKAGVGFVSIENQIDYSTPQGKFMLAMQGGLAELYSDNLSEECKKGWSERKEQGLYCGLLPFGAVKGEDGVPVPHPDTYPGLVMAFKLAAQGNSDREVAMALNSKGYRTAGNRGNGPFCGDTVGGILTNRFYLGQLPDGNGGWVQGKHEAFINEDLWNGVQEMRARNAKSTHTRCRSNRGPYALTGIAYCWYCKGRMNIGCNINGPRLTCSTRSKGWDCFQPSAYLSVYEGQIHQYLSVFHIPEDYQDKILEAHRRLQSAYSDVDRDKARLEAKLQRVKDLYELGDIDRDEYLAKREGIRKELRSLVAGQHDASNLDRLAQFLANVSSAWEAANGEQRNKLARCLFEEVWIKDKTVVAVKPRPELEPFFRLNYEEFLRQNNEHAAPKDIGH